MKLKHMLTALLVAHIGAGSAAYAEMAKIPVITGKPYNQAREMLLADGWQPAPTHGPNEELFGQVASFAKAGFKEIHDCAGTGAAPCIVFFRDAYGSFLKVVTVGESELQGEDFPVVDNFQLVKELPAMQVEALVEQPQPVAKAIKKAGWSDSTVQEWCANVSNWYRLSAEARNSGIPEPEWRGDISRLLAMVNYNVPAEQEQYMHAGTTAAYKEYPYARPDQLERVGLGTCLSRSAKNRAR